LYGWSCDGCNEVVVLCNYLTHEKKIDYQKKRMQSILGLESKMQITLHWILVWKQDVHPFSLGLKSKCAYFCVKILISKASTCVIKVLGVKVKQICITFGSTCVIQVCALLKGLSLSLLLEYCNSF
jgi:hypothetical protein